MIEPAELLDLAVDARAARLFRGRRVEQLTRIRQYGVGEQQRGIVDEVRKLRVEPGPSFRALEPRLREEQRFVGREHRAIQGDRLLPQLAPLESEAARFSERDLLQLRALLGLRKPFLCFPRTRAGGERGFEARLRVGEVFVAEQAERCRQQPLELGVAQLAMDVVDGGAGRRPTGIQRERLAIARHRRIELAARAFAVCALDERQHGGKPLRSLALCQRLRVGRFDGQHEIVLLDRQLGVTGGERGLTCGERAFDGRGRARDDRVAERRSHRSS